MEILPLFLIAYEGLQITDGILKNTDYRFQVTN